MDTKKALKFLKDLSKNNSKEWFEKNKADFKEIKTGFDEFTQQVIDGIAKFDPAVSELEGKKCVYRIYRDVRFSKDKTPYKTHMGASITPGGKKSPLAGYYIHLEPGGKSIIAGGVWQPESANLKKIREEIDYNADELKKVLGKKSFKDQFSELYDDQLKTAPKGYPKDHPDLDLLKYKSYLVFREINDKTAGDADALLKDMLKGAKEMKPFLDFLNAPLRD